MHNIFKVITDGNIKIFIIIEGITLGLKPMRIREMKDETRQVEEREN